MKKEPTIFILLRHGETEANKAGILQGWFESPLDENGREQAACAAEYLKERRIDAVYSSDLGRAVETAHIAMKYHPEGEFHTDWRLREWNAGIYEGRKQAELVANHPEVIKCFVKESLNPVMPGGESRAQFQARVNEFFLETAEANPGKSILICTHGGTMSRIFRMATGCIDDNNRCPMPSNASVSSIVYLPEQQGWQLTEWNIKHYLSHLSIIKTLVV